MLVSFGNPLLTYSLTHLLTYSLTHLLTYLLTTTRWCSSPSACYPWCTGRGSPPLSNGCATTACCCSCLPCVRAKPSPDAHPRGRRQLSSEPSTSIVSLTSRPSPLTLTHHLYPRRYPRPRPHPHQTASVSPSSSCVDSPSGGADRGSPCTASAPATCGGTYVWCWPSVRGTSTVGASRRTHTTRAARATPKWRLLARALNVTPCKCICTIYTTRQRLSHTHIFLMVISDQIKYLCTRCIPVRYRELIEARARRVEQLNYSPMRAHPNKIL